MLLSNGLGICSVRVWASECDISFSRSPIACFIATRTEQILGFACYHSTCKNFFGPTGVTKDSQGLGIGTAMLLACLHAMAADGYAYAVIGGVKDGGFYKKIAGAMDIKEIFPRNLSKKTIKNHALNRNKNTPKSQVPKNPK